MTILILNYEFPPLGGGAGKVALQQCNYLSHFHNVIVVTAGTKNLPFHEKKLNIDIYRLPSLRKKIHRSNVLEMLSWLYHARKFCFKLLRSQHIDLIIAHFTLPGGELSYRIYKKMGIPYIIQSHGHDIPWFFPRQMWLYHMITYFRIRQICIHAQRIVLLTPKLKQIADRFTGNKHKHKNIIIPNGCDVDIFQLMTRENQFDQFRILFTGRLVAQKNPLLLLKALQKIALKNIDFEAHIVGDGPKMKSMKKFVQKHNLHHKIILHGWQTQEYIAELMQQANIFILPSRAEAMSMAILEALCSGMYVITTPHGDQHNLIQPGINGNILNINSKDKLAQLIMEYYSNFFMNKKSVNAESILAIRNKFNYANIGQQYLELINQCQH